MYSQTTATRKIASLRKRIRAVQGGTSASKTISILIYLIACAQSDTEPTLTSVVSESVPHLKRGAMRDFKNIMKAQGYWVEANWNATDSIYTFETGSQMEFFSADSADKLRGGRRDRLFMNEANNCSFEAFDQLEVRTRQFIFLDWNPSTEFWLYTDVCNCTEFGCSGKRTDVEHIKLTFLDNEALDPATVKSIKQRKNRVGWYKVYGQGLLGEVEGRIYKDWRIIDEVPHEARLVRRGLDFGYSQDPAAIVDIYEYNGGYIWDEQLYQKGKSNQQLAEFMQNLEPILTIADSAEPKSIDDLILYDIEVLPANKGKDSVNYGIKIVQSQRISMTKRSVHLIKEYRNYLWMVDKNGKILTTPEKGGDHLLDAGRYAMETLNIDTGLSPVDEYMMAEARRQSGINYTR